MGTEKIVQKKGEKTAAVQSLNFVSTYIHQLGKLESWRKAIKNSLLCTVPRGTNFDELMLEVSIAQLGLMVESLWTG